MITISPIKMPVYTSHQIVHESISRRADNSNLDLQYNSNPQSGLPNIIEGPAKVYLIFWGSQWSSIPRRSSYKTSRLVKRFYYYHKARVRIHGRWDIVWRKVYYTHKARVRVHDRWKIELRRTYRKIKIWDNHPSTPAIPAPGDPQHIASKLVSFYASIGTRGEKWSNIATQYCTAPDMIGPTTICPSDATYISYPSGGALGGVWYNNSSRAPEAATQQQIATEATLGAIHFGINSSKTNAQYIVVSPSGTHPDDFPQAGYCAYHNYIYWNGQDVPYTNMPYTPDMGGLYKGHYGYCNYPGESPANGITVIAGHEFAETLTDPSLTSWYNSTTLDIWNRPIDLEIADICSWNDNGGYLTKMNGFDVQTLWSNKTASCVASN